VSLNATIINDATSTDNFDLDAAITMAVASSFPTAYDPVFGPGGGVNILSQFNGIVLSPGASFDFIFATLTPDPAPVAPGDYYVTFPGLMISDVMDYWQIRNPLYDSYPDSFNPYIQEYVNGSAKITVADPGGSGSDTSEAPEPSTLALMLFAVAGVGFSRRKRIL